MSAYFFQPDSGPAQEDKVTVVQFQFLFTQRLETARVHLY
jgi:hypothetical protein